MIYTQLTCYSKQKYETMETIKHISIRYWIYVIFLSSNIWNDHLFYRSENVITNYFWLPSGKNLLYTYGRNIVTKFQLKWQIEKIA